MFENEIINALWPVIILNIVGIVTLIIYAFKFYSNPKDRDTTLPEFTHKTFVGPYLRGYLYWITTPLFYIFIKLRITPNTLTLVSPVLAALSGYYYFLGHIASAGWLLFGSGIFDGLDGRLARKTNQMTKEGAYLDSNLDRYSDGFFFGGLALYFRNDLTMLFVTILCIIGSEVTSYSKARGECYGINAKVGLMQRSERFVLLGITSIFHPFLMLILKGYGITTEYPIIIALILMAVLTNYTAIVRIVYIFKALRKGSK
jgi:CDP-diacylglycerol---glycerol-3-phosphate 3-phosphatidyltransferase